MNPSARTTHRNGTRREALEWACEPEQVDERRRRDEQGRDPVSPRDRHLNLRRCVCTQRAVGSRPSPGRRANLARSGACRSVPVRSHPTPGTPQDPDPERDHAKRPDHVPIQLCQLEAEHVHERVVDPHPEDRSARGGSPRHRYCAAYPRPSPFPSGRSRQWLGAVPAAGVWAARQSLPSIGECRSAIAASAKRRWSRKWPRSARTGWLHAAKSPSAGFENDVSPRRKCPQRTKGRRIRRPARSASDTCWRPGRVSALQGPTVTSRVTANASRQRWLGTGLLSSSVYVQLAAAG